MAKTRTALRAELRGKYLKLAMEAFASEDVLQYKSNAFAFPVVDSEGNEEFITVTISTPTGSRDDGEPWDGYAEAEAFAMKQKRDAEKAEANRRKTEEKKKKKKTAEKKEDGEG